MKWIFPLSFVLLLAACGSGPDAGPYDDILSRDPFALLTDSIRKMPKQDELYFRRAVLLNRNNLPEPALADFQKAWSLHAEERYAVGAANLLLDKRPDSAVAFITTALKVLPKSIFLQLLLARAFDAEQQTDQAIAACDRALQESPEQVNLLMLKSELLKKKQDTAAVIATLEKAYQLAPGNLEISNKLAYQYAESRNPKAINLSDTMIREDSLQLHPEPYYVKAVYYSNINDRANAIRLFDETIRHDHRYLNAYIEKGKIQLDQKKIAEALKTFQLANTISPAFPDAWYWMGRCQEAMGQQQEAKINYEKAYGLDKTFTAAKEAADKLPGE